MADGNIPIEQLGQHKGHFEKLPPEYQYISNETLRIANSSDIDDFYGISASYMSTCAKHNSSNPLTFKKLKGFTFSFNTL